MGKKSRKRLAQQIKPLHPIMCQVLDCVRRILKGEK